MSSESPEVEAFLQVKFGLEYLETQTAILTGCSNNLVNPLYCIIWTDALSTALHGYLYISASSNLKLETWNLVIFEPLPTFA